jgi:hypothetical protein
LSEQSHSLAFGAEVPEENQNFANQVDLSKLGNKGTGNSLQHRCCPFFDEQLH